MSNGTDYGGGGAAYDPNAPVPRWHQNMELATICVTNSLTLLIIITRISIRRHRLKRFRRDDIWIMFAGVFLLFPYWVCQLGTNRYGSGLHSDNVPDSWVIPLWKFEMGWVGYYIVVSMIKVSICMCLLEILPHTFRRFRALVYILCFILMSLGIAESLVWIFQCQPFLSNFVYAVQPTWCLNIDSARFAWVGLSIPLDLIMVAIPFAIIRQIRLEAHERGVLFVVFGANLLGTAASIFGIYGIWLNRNSNAFADLSYSESVFVMTNDIEIFMYALGASATVFSRPLINFYSRFSTPRLASPTPTSPLSWRHKMASTFSGVHDLPSPWTGHTSTVVTAESTRGKSLFTATDTYKMGMTPKLNDVGGLGGDWGWEKDYEIGTGRKGSTARMLGRDDEESDMESQRHASDAGMYDQGAYRERHMSWYGASEVPVSPAKTVWDWKGSQKDG